MRMPEVDILLAAYNGEAFIAEQITSILVQTFQDFRLIIRDDASTDNTPAILEEYAASYPGKIQIVHDDVICRSATSNFFQLLKYADADYVMFSDQDDYWLPYKVQVTLDFVKKAEQEHPGKAVMGITGLWVVDEKLNSMERFMALEITRKDYGSIISFGTRSRASGCTEMLNRKAYQGLGEYSPLMTVHDNWAAVYVRAMGEIVHVPMALILYRQHRDNSIGATDFTPGAVIRRIMAGPVAKYRESRKSYYKFGAMLELLHERHAEEMTPERRRELEDCIAVYSRKSGVFTRLAALRRLRFFADNGLFETLKMAVKVITL